MTSFRLLVVALFALLLVYTGITVSNEGWNFYPVYFADVAGFSWRGQFDVDFSCFLILSAVWLMWRHHFSAAGIISAICVSTLGALFLTAYLLVASFNANGDVSEILLGKKRIAT